MNWILHVYWVKFNAYLILINLFILIWVNFWNRLWWILAFSLSLYCCGSTIQNIWMQWYNKPVTLSISEKESPISMIPFPTVTICPHIKFRHQKLDLPNAYRNWSQAPENISDIQYEWKLEFFNDLLNRKCSKIRNKERCSTYKLLPYTFWRNFLGPPIYVWIFK